MYGLQDWGPRGFIPGRSLFVRQIPRIRPDVDRQVPIEGSGGRDLAQLERRSRAIKSPSEFLALRQEPDDLVVLGRNPSGLVSMTMVRCAADACAARPSRSASVVLAVAIRLAAERVNTARVGIIRFMCVSVSMSSSGITSSAPESRWKCDARPQLAHVYSWLAMLGFRRGASYPTSWTRRNNRRACGLAPSARRSSRFFWWTWETRRRSRLSRSPPAMSRSRRWSPAAPSA